MSAMGGQGAPGPAAAVQGGRRRARGLVMVGIGCATVVTLLWLAATAGGVAYLVLDRRAQQASLATFDSGRFRFDYPVEWFAPPRSPNAPHPDQLVELQNADRTKYVTVLDMQGTMTAQDECESNSRRIEDQGLGSVQNEVIGEREVAGRHAIHHRAVATGQEGELTSSLLDTWCIQKPDGVVLFVAQIQSNEVEPAPMPEATEILDSWQWASAAG